MQVTLLGDWKKATRLMVRLEPNLYAAALIAQRRFSEKLHRLVKSHLRNQDLDWAPLDTGYVKHKERVGKNPDKILRYSDLYYQSIKVWRASGVYYVGVKENFTYPSGDSIYDVANWLEYGTRKMVARPLWKPSLEELAGRHRNNTTLLLRDWVFYYMLSKQYPISKKSVFNKQWKFS